MPEFPSWGCFLSTPTSGPPTTHTQTHCLYEREGGREGGRVNAACINFLGVSHTFLGVRFYLGSTHCTLRFPLCSPALA